MSLLTPLDYRTQGQFGSHVGVGMLAFIVAETANQEIVRVRIIMSLRIL
jgi:hypothetical protein